MPLTPVSDPRHERQQAISSSARLRAAIAYSCIIGGGSIAALLLKKVHPGLAFSAACILLALSFLTRRLFPILLAAALLCLATGYYQLRINFQSSDSLANRIAAATSTSPSHDAILSFRGVLSTNARLTPHQGPPLGQYLHQSPSARCNFKVEEIQTSLDSGTRWQKTSGSLWLKIELAAPDLSPIRAHAGDRIEITGLVRPLGRPNNPGDFDSADWAADHNFAGSITLSSPDLITQLPSDSSLLDRATRTFTRFKENLSTRSHDTLSRATNTFSEKDRSLILALILGENPTDQSLNQAFLRLGLAHVLAISGFHLVVMVQLFLLLLRLTGDRGRLEPLLAAALVILYMLIVPAQAPITRSGITCLTMLIAQWLGRRYDSVTLLIWISAALLIVHPTDLWSLGYQLSCGLTILLFWLGEHARNTLFLPQIRGTVRTYRPTLQRIPHYLAEHSKELIATTILCSLISMPLIAARTGSISPLVLLATILIVPPITILLWIAFIALIVGLIAPSIADVLTPVLDFTAHAVTTLLDAVDSLPLTSFRVIRPDYLWAAAATMLVVAWFIRRRRRDRLMWSLSLVMVAWISIECGVHFYKESQRHLRIDMLAVGDGSCLIIRSQGHTILWDAGSLRPGMGSDTIVHALTDFNITTIDAVYITHPDIDHFGGLPTLISTFNIKNIYTCERFVSQSQAEPKSAAATLSAIAKSSGCQIKSLHAGDKNRFGQIMFEILSPPRPEPSWKVDNNHSLVARLTYQQKQHALLTGDLQEEGLVSLARNNPDLHPQALELMHHGSFNAAAMNFVQQIQPQIVLQSTSQRRENDQRWKPVRDATQEWYTTSADGAIFIEWRPDGTCTSGAFQR